MDHEGIVTKLKENGKADVIIQPPGAGVPGVSKEINARVCHCATPASTITIEALNSAGAGVGDRVSVMRDTSTLLKNCGILLGIPLAGLIGGIALTFLITDRSSSVHPAGVAAGITFTLVAVALSIVWYRRSSVGSDPVIDRILQVAGKTGAEMCGGVFPIKNKGSACNTCSGNV